MRNYFSALYFVFLCAVGSAAYSADITFVKQNSEPKYLPDDSGLCDQVYSQLINELKQDGLQGSVDAQFYPIKRILKMLDADQADVFCGAGSNDERRQRYVYSDLPVYAVSNVIMSHKNETTRPESFENIIELGLVVGSFYGTTSSAWLKSNIGNLISDNHHSLDNVASMMADQRRLRYFYYHDLGLNHYVAKNGLPLKVWPTKYRTVDQWLLINPNLEAEKITAINRALKAIHESGALTSIHNQYLN